MNTKSHGSIVLNALLTGLEVKLGSYNYRLFKPDEEVTTPSGSGVTTKHWLGIRMEQDGKPVYCGSELSVVELVGEAEKLPSDEIASLAANITLNQSRRSNRSIS